MPLSAIHSRMMIVLAAILISAGILIAQSWNGGPGEPAQPKTQPKFSISVRHPQVPQGADSGRRDYHGNVERVACNTCHQNRPANLANRRSADLDEFHQGLKVAHGPLACASCHNPADAYMSLRLADGSQIEFIDSIQLCAQCHGVQYRDYKHGAHGGMTGYWDLSRGPRTRNHCTHCHDPHAPAYPLVRPAAGPRDRFPPARLKESHE